MVSRFGFQHFAVFLLAAVSAGLAFSGGTPAETVELVLLNVGVIAAVRLAARERTERALYKRRAY